MNNLGDALAGQRKFDEAEELYRKTVELRQKVLGKAHAATILSMNDLQWIFVQSDRLEEAEKVLREMLVSATKAYGPEDSREHHARPRLPTYEHGEVRRSRRLTSKHSKVDE